MIKAGSIDTINNAPIPWDRGDETNPLYIPEGTWAVVPVLDSGGEKTGKFETLTYEDYMREMGKAAYTRINGRDHYLDEDYSLKTWWPSSDTEEGEA